MSNLLKALIRAVQNEDQELLQLYQSNNRANAMGDALEEYIKDIFAGISPNNRKGEVIDSHSSVFSYLGNPNHPPDCILRAGDAIEVKKVMGIRSGLALNSSYPKSKLHVDDSRITQPCRNCEKWTEKDIIYAVGCVPKNKLKILWFVYGDCYAARRETYEKIHSMVKSSLANGDIETAETNELAQVRRVDPLGITSLRVRGMWHIDNPANVFDYLNAINMEKEFQIVAIMQEAKYLSFPDEDRKNIESNKSITIRSEKIKSPDNPAKLINIKLITFSK